MLDAARFDPTTHFERGPVPVELQIDYFINPPVPGQSLYEPGQALVGDEAAEVMGGGRADRGRYAAVLARGEPPVLDVGDGELILSFLLTVDAGGSVESSELFRDSRSPRNPEPESTPESERLLEYLRTFPFRADPCRGCGTGWSGARARPAGVAAGGGGRHPGPRRGGAGPPAREIYRLAAGRNLDLRPPRHPPERMLLYRTGNPIQARAIPDGPSQMAILWTDDGPRLRGGCFGATIWSPCSTPSVFAEAPCASKAGRGTCASNADIVTREGASREELLRELPRVLEERLDLDVGLRSVSEVSRTLVLRGSVGAVPLDERDGQRVLHAFTDRRDPRTGAGGGPFPMPATWSSSCRITSACPSSTGRPGRPTIPFTCDCTRRQSGRDGWTC